MPETTHGTQGNGRDHRGLGERVGQINQSAQELWSEAQGAVHQLRESLDLTGRVDRHPYGMVLAALGVGYLLGGGLFSRLTTGLLGLGFRVAALPVVKEELLHLAKNALAGMGEGAGAGEAQGEPPRAAPTEPPKTV